MFELTEVELSEILFQISARIEFVEEITREYGQEAHYTKELNTLRAIRNKLEVN